MKVCFKFHSAGEVRKFLEIGAKYISEEQVLYDLSDESYTSEVETCKENVQYLTGVSDTITTILGG